MSMNPKIISQVLQSSGSKFVDGQNLEKIIKNCPVLDSNTLSALSTSITDLLLHKVPRDMRQKYAVRQHIIQVFRGFIRPPAGLAFHPAFCDSRKLTEFAEILVTHYFQQPLDYYQEQNLCILGRLLIDLALSRPMAAGFLRYIQDSLINKITDADPESTQDLVLLLLQYREQLQLDFRTIERLYVHQHAMLIEDPLIDTFLVNINKQIEDFVFSSPFNSIIRYAGQSAKIFQSTCSIIRALFAELNYSPLVLDFNKFVLYYIASNRTGKNHTRDLYPEYCMPCLILMTIDPTIHTFNTKNHLLQILRNIYAKKQPGVGILIIHMPIWLDAVVNLIEDYF